MLVALADLPAGSLWRQRATGHPGARAIAADGDALVHDPSARDVELLARYAALAPGADPALRASALIGIAGGASPVLAGAAVDRLRTVPQLTAAIPDAALVALLETRDRRRAAAADPRRDRRAGRRGAPAGNAPRARRVGAPRRRARSGGADGARRRRRWPATGARRGAARSTGVRGARRRRALRHRQRRRAPPALTGAQRSGCTRPRRRRRGAGEDAHRLGRGRLRPGARRSGSARAIRGGRSARRAGCAGRADLGGCRPHPSRRGARRAHGAGVGGSARASRRCGG